MGFQNEWEKSIELQTIILNFIQIYSHLDKEKIVFRLARWHLILVHLMTTTIPFSAGKWRLMYVILKDDGLCKIHNLKKQSLYEHLLFNKTIKPTF